MFNELLKTNWMEMDDVFLRAIVSLITLFLITKLLGKKQVAQLSIFDYVIGISIGNFAAEMTLNLEVQFINGVVSVIIFGLCAYLISIVTMKSILLRRFFIGTPTILMEKGKLIEKAMKKVKFDVNDLLEECRNAGYFDLSQIDTIIMEVNGKLSILPKKEYKPLTTSDMNVKVMDEGLCANVIIDGKIMNNNLQNMNKTEKWLKHELKIKGYTTIDNLLLVTLDKNQKITVYEKNKNIQAKQILE